MREVIHPVRGTKDLLGDECRLHRSLVATALKIAECYGFEEIATPIFETAQVFLRSLGDTSDVVSKEMYILHDKNGDHLALRPEGTAGVVRAFVSHGLAQTLPQKLFYAGPMFRYERPQKGRQRQFHQIGVEIIGAAEPLADVEVIALGWQFLQEVGLSAEVTLHLNTLGDLESRQAFRAALVAYFSKVKERLSAESKVRLEKNPLRILDSKDDGDRTLIQDAPKGHSYLTAAARAFFDDVRRGLDALKVPYVVDEHVVRGLDYYCHTAFEFVSSHLGAQSTVMAGGRYDGLTEAMGGVPLPGVGWGAGIERLALLSPPPKARPAPVAVVPVGDEAMLAAMLLAQDLRQRGVHTLCEYSGTVGKRMKKAAKSGAAYALLLGEEEMKNSQVTLKNLETGEQQQRPLQLALDALSEEHPGL